MRIESGIVIETAKSKTPGWSSASKSAYVPPAYIPPKPKRPFVSSGVVGYVVDNIEDQYGVFPSEKSAQAWLDARLVVDEDGLDADGVNWDDAIVRPLKGKLIGWK